VLGFFVHVADVTALKAHERHLAHLVRERDRALAEVRTLRGLFPICASCKRIRDENDNWISIEGYVSARTELSFTHGVCPQCAAHLYPGMTPDPEA